MSVDESVISGVRCVCVLGMDCHVFCRLFEASLSGECVYTII